MNIMLKKENNDTKGRKNLKDFAGNVEIEFLIDLVMHGFIFKRLTLIVIHSTI